MMLIIYAFPILFSCFLHRLPQKHQATIILRSPHSPCNIATHMNDFIVGLNLKQEVIRGRTLLVLVVDGGADFNVNHTVNEFYYARLFKECNLDAMIVTSYCPGDSAFNPIERVWSPCTQALTSVYLPAVLEGETRPPCAQAGLSTEEKMAKEHTVFNTAMELINHRYWKDITFGGKEITTKVKASGSAEHPYSCAEYREVHKSLTSSATQLKANEPVYEEFRFTSKHMDRRIGMAIFSKCVDPTDCIHCETHPTKHVDMLKSVKDLPSPKPSIDFPGHFMSLIEALESERELACEHLPKFQEKNLGRCPVLSCKYVFTSQKDKTDHRLKSHSARPSH